MNEIEVVNDVNLKDGKRKSFLFSIIIPIYNVEKYIVETIESVIQQTLNFEEHVQLIIVNDGSPDNSEEVCLPYVQKYPNNITYIKKENGGVSSARNLGLKFVQGEYVNFLDSDDKFEENVLEEVYDFFTKNKNEIDLVAIPLYFFEAQNGPHILNYKFKKSGVIDLHNRPDHYQLSSSSCFIKKDLAQKYNFDTRLKYAEDAKYVSQIVLEKMKYGVLSNVKYLYRRRLDGTSAIQKGYRVKDWYTQYVINFSEDLIKYCLEKYDKVPLYIQYLIMYDLQWRFHVGKVENYLLNDEELDEYINKLINVLNYIEDKVIFAQKNLGFHLKVYIMKLKYKFSKEQLLKHVQVGNDIKVYLGGFFLGSLSNEKVQIDSLEIKGNTIFLEGCLAGSFSAQYINLDVFLNDKKIETEKVSRAHDTIRFMGDTVKEVYGFKAEFKIKNWKKENQIRFKVNYGDVAVLVDYDLRHRVRFSKNMPNYYAKDKLLVHCIKYYIKVVPNTFLKHAKKELGMFKRLLEKGDRYAVQAIFIRSLYYIYKMFNRRPIYLYMDRIFKAGDNAQRLFEYSLEQNDDVKKYFILSKDSEDYQELSKKGEVIPYNSRKHRFYMLLADKFISSHADEPLLNPFGDKGLIHYKDLMDYDFVFLQHGVIVHDLSNWLYKYKKNIKLFVTSAEPEYNSIVNGDYGYSEKEVKLVGLPRFDLLENKHQKKILIMPTWRKELAGTINPNTLEREYNENFNKSLYFKVFNDLLNDKQLLATAKKYDYKIVFYPHPNITKQVKDFDISSNIEIANKTSSYKEYFNSSSLLITDYSSVAYDFSYQKKPIIYYHFEPIHWDLGYFDYEEMGFGEVKTTHQELVEKIIHYMENDCEMEELFKKRVNNFYEFSDKNNSKRVYEEIQKIIE